MSEKKLYVVSYHDVSVRHNLVFVDGVGVDKRHYYVSDHAEAYKIGVAEDPESRLSTLQSGTPNELRLITTAESDDAPSVESDLHSIYRNRLIQGEWFDLPLNDVNSLKALDYIDSANIHQLKKKDIRCEWDLEKGLYVQLMELLGDGR